MEQGEVAHPGVGPAGKEDPIDRSPCLLPVGALRSVFSGNPLLRASLPVAKRRRSVPRYTQ